MFTGICEEIGRVKTVLKMTDRIGLVISAARVLEETKTGDSILVSGVCLTVTGLLFGAFQADVLAASLEKTSLGGLTPGGRVNLERALRADSRLGGHILQGHVHGAVPIRELKREGENVYLVLEPGEDVMNYCVREGAVAVEGISLTISEISEKSLTINLIPETIRRTTLGEKKTGDLVNIETDILGRYVEKFLRPWKNHAASGEKHLTTERLRELGY